MGGIRKSWVGIIGTWTRLSWTSFCTGSATGIEYELGEVAFLIVHSLHVWLFWEVCSAFVSIVVIYLYILNWGHLMMLNVMYIILTKVTIERSFVRIFDLSWLIVFFFINCWKQFSFRVFLMRSFARCHKHLSFRLDLVGLV